MTESDRDREQEKTALPRPRQHGKPASGEVLFREGYGEGQQYDCSERHRGECHGGEREAERMAEDGGERS